MKIYLVGGAVRNQLLGLPVHEKDWVVVGATPDELLQQGYRQVGKEFPVFLHPTTHEEYALARTECKVGAGHTGFVCQADPSVSLEEDLQRRDLTINAIAQDEHGSLIDPFQGQQDIEKRVLRHVSNAFSEDPLRVLRVARFQAQLAAFEFQVAPETLALMQQMVAKQELENLSAERIWQECDKALQAPQAWHFFRGLAACHALAILFPSVTQDNIVQLQHACEHTNDPHIRFAALMTPVQHATTLSLTCPNAYRDIVKLTQQYAESLSHAQALTPEALLDIFKHADLFRRPERFQQGLIACQLAYASHQQPFPLAWIQQAAKAVTTVDIQPLLSQALTGPDLANAIQQLRLSALSKKK